jgi:hypothetical protein
MIPWDFYEAIKGKHQPEPSDVRSQRHGLTVAWNSGAGVNEPAITRKWPSSVYSEEYSRVARFRGNDGVLPSGNMISGRILSRLSSAFGLQRKSRGEFETRQMSVEWQLCAESKTRPTATAHATSESSRDHRSAPASSLRYQTELPGRAAK